jgi:hypothetical protein
MVMAMLCLLLAGCASAQNRAYLTRLELDCAHGDQPSCNLIPEQREINRDEAISNGFKGAAIAVLLPILALGAVAEAREEAGICGWGRHTYAC